SMTAKAGRGIEFAGWSGSLSTNSPTITFVMASNLTLKANFVNTNSLYGNWSNCDSKTHELVSLMLTAQGDTSLEVHPFGACTPMPCDWGVVTGRVYSDNPFNESVIGFTAEFDFGFSTDLVSGYLDGDTLVVDDYTVFHDNSGRLAYYIQNRFCKSR